MKSSVSDFNLDQEILHFRLGVASISNLSLAISPVFWDIFVKMVHPCWTAVFYDNGGITSPIVAPIKNMPHPSPIHELISPFPHNLEATYDCGP